MAANDELVVVVDLVNVLSQRPLKLRLRDLSGNLLYEEEQGAVAGRQTLVWDGRIDGRVVPAGLYLMEVEVEGDAENQTEIRVLPIVY